MYYFIIFMIFSIFYVNVEKILLSGNYYNFIPNESSKKINQNNFKRQFLIKNQTRVQCPMIWKTFSNKMVNFRNNYYNDFAAHYIFFCITNLNINKNLISHLIKN